ncbi:MAG: CRTAC1 family protein [Phycisphaerales bacterium]
MAVGSAVCIVTVTSHASAAGPLGFTNEALARGFNFRLGFNYHQVGAGNMLVDLDNDGDLDIVIAGGLGGVFGLFENDGTGNFTDRSATAGLAPMINASGLSAADYDNDGFMDIHVPGWFVPSRLYRNNGDFTFTDVAPQAGVDISAPSMAAAWGDYDQDGHLDLYATVRTFTDGVEIENHFFRNNGDGTFTDVAVALGVEAPGDPSCLPAFFDYDRDGDDDIYIGTDKGSKDGPFMLHNKLYRNNGDGTFYNATYETGTEAYIFCMGIAVGDLNFDGYFDMYLTNIMQGNILYMHDGNAAYEDMTEPAGMLSHRVGWGTVFADFDNDTHLDTYVCNIQGANRLYRGEKAWPLQDEAPQAGVDVIWDVYCVSVGDVDADGDLDMLVGNTNRRAHLFINHSADLATNNWARFTVQGQTANHHGIGTVVEVAAAGKTQVREVRSGVNYKSQDELTLHYGLGAADAIDSVTAFFPGGQTRTLTNVPVNTAWMLYSPGRLGDPNNDGVTDTTERLAALAAYTGSGGTLSPGDEIFDFDGDFDIDVHDIAAIGRGLRTPMPR